MKLRERAAGITVPLFSVRVSPDSGIGEIPDLVPLAEWASTAGQSIVALLPLGDSAPTESSPYNALTSFGIDPLYLSVPGSASAAAEARVDRPRVWARKRPLLLEGFERFRRLSEETDERRRFAAFRRRAAGWLDEYALFRALAEAHGWISWKDWPAPLRDREPEALAGARKGLSQEIGFAEYVQFLADEQWRAAREGCARFGVRLMGDLPFAPSDNSADVWANQALFDPERSVGAPPDEFSDEGQRWGLPMYRWDAHRASGWLWWRLRVARMAELYDLFRIDHVVGLFRTFAFAGDAEIAAFDPPDVPAQQAQGREILTMIREAADPATVVAEDLGSIPDFVRETLEELDVPGYKVFLWERDEDEHRDPQDYPECSIATTGTHDTDPLTVWWEALEPEEKLPVVTLAGADDVAATPEALGEPMRRRLLELVYGSASRYAILPLQDVFGWRERINLPATVSGANWSFRFPRPIGELGGEAELRALVDGAKRLRSTRSMEKTPSMEELKTGSVRANGLDFHYLEAGEGPLVLCLHGFPDHARTFREQLPALAKAGYRAVAPYLRGYAPTTVPPDGPFQPAALAVDTVALLEALSPKEAAYVFGHDWGAVAAYGAALAAPERVRKLATAAVPYGPQVFGSIFGAYRQMRRSWYMFFFQLPGMPEAAVSANDFEFLEHMWSDWSPDWTYPPQEMTALKETFKKPGVLEAALGYYRHTLNPALQRPELAALQSRIMAEPIEVESLVFHGERDGCVGVELLDGMEAFFPKGLKKVVVPGAGHFVHQEKPDTVNRELVAFFR